MVAHASFNPRLRQTDLYEIKISVVYIVSSRSAGGIKQNKKQNKRMENEFLMCPLWIYYLKEELECFRVSLIQN